MSFDKISREQIKSYKVSGKKIRLNSKLINSNIALCTRIDLILETIWVFIKSLDLSAVETDLTKEDYELLVKLQDQRPYLNNIKTTFHINKLPLYLQDYSDTKGAPFLTFLNDLFEVIIDFSATAGFQITAFLFKGENEFRDRFIITVGISYMKFFVQQAFQLQLAYGLRRQTS
ncbi:MAG: hypothetical protein ACI8X3_001312, partial [Saprospiraceae bacterium]